jgi:hypothetical protein
MACVPRGGLESHLCFGRPSVRIWASPLESHSFNLYLGQDLLALVASRLQPRLRLLWLSLVSSFGWSDLCL